MTSIARAGCAAAALTLVVSACSGNPKDPATTSQPPSATASVPTSSTPSTGTTPEVELGKDYALDASAAAYPRPKALATKTGTAGKRGRAGWRVELQGVQRIGADRVLVTGWINGDAAHTNASAFTEPGFRGIGRDGEFSDFTLTVAGDPATYLPVRSRDRLCVCTRQGKSKPAGDVPVYVVMSAPATATSVSLAMPEVGSFANVAVSPAAETTPAVSPLPGGWQLRVAGANRPTPGTVRAELAIEHPDVPWGSQEPRPVAFVNGVSRWGNSLVQRGFEGLMAGARGAGLTGTPPTTDKHCTCTAMGLLPGVGQGVQVQLDLADPGTATVDLYPTSGLPLLGVPVEGSPSVATSNTVQIPSRSRAVALTVNKGPRTRLDLDSSVLFALDSAKLTAKANATLDAAVKALKAQNGRGLAIAGHTDSQGSDAHNLTLSRQRAEAVRRALTARLGSGWSFTVKGVGEADPLAPEKGSAQDIKDAQALNRRVEVQVK